MAQSNPFFYLQNLKYLCHILEGLAQKKKKKKYNTIRLIKESICNIKTYIHDRYI